MHIIKYYGPDKNHVHLKNNQFIRVTHLKDKIEVIEYENDGRNPWYYGHFFKTEYYVVNDNNEKIKDKNNKTGFRTAFKDVQIVPLNFALTEDIVIRDSKLLKIDEGYVEYLMLNRVHWFI